MFFQFRKAILFLLIFIPAISAQEKVKLSLEYTGRRLPFGLTEKVPADFPKITIALSGGGSRGIAHLGGLKAFEENNIPFDCIFGTSMGSIIGGMYAAGYDVQQIDSIVTAAKWDSFFSTREINRNELFVDQKVTEEKAIFAVRLNGLTPVIPSSINTGQPVANFLNLITLFAPIHADDDFGKLLYDFKAVCTDFTTGKLVVLDKGSLSQAMRASSSVSLLLPPVEKDSMQLVDGGLVANIPVKPAKEYGADLVIAVNTSSPLNPADELNLPWKIADQMVSIPMKILNEQQLKLADAVIEPAIGDLDNTDFSKIPFVVEQGYKAAMQNMELIKAEIKNRFMGKIKTDNRFFGNLILDINPTDCEKQLYNALPNKDLVSSRQLLYGLYNVCKGGDVDSSYIELIPSGDKFILKVSVKKNPIINGVELNGITLVDFDRIENLFKDVEGKPYNGRRILKAVLASLFIYRSAGYPFAEVKDISFNPVSGLLTVSFDEVKISRIEVSGNIKTQRDIITREFVFENGNIKFDAIQKGLMNLRATNLFDDVEVYKQSEDGINYLKIDVKEKLPTVMRFGLRVDNEYYTQASIDLRDENFMGAGAEFGFIFSGGVRNHSISLEHKANRVFDSYLSYKLRAFYDATDISVYSYDTTAADNRFIRNKTGEYTQSSFGLSVGLGAQVEKFGNLFVETKYQVDRIKDNGGYTGEKYRMGILSLRLGFSIDSQNKFPFPTSGFLIKAYYETAQSILGSDIGYTKLYFDYKNIVSINRFNTFTTHFIIGAADNPLPLSQNFSLGGLDSFYGMRQYEFRGRQILLGSIEYRYMLPFNLFFDTYVKLRYDIGSIWSEKEQIRFKDLRHGLGTALAFDTPIGPAEFAVGESFYFKNTLAKNILVLGSPFFYFSIGYAF